jgi:hypothetical protein
MIILRRMILLIALMFWQGGFMFYGVVVVPVGAEVLGSHRAQGRITRPVTNYLHGAGAVCLIAWCWEVVSERGTSRRFRWALLIALAVALAIQVGLHNWLETLLDAEPLQQPLFGQVHQAYLIVSTAQWLLALTLIALTVQSWSAKPEA